jgi:predicted RNase H-like HicB family nuclease
VFPGEHQYVAECREMPVVTQAHTLDALAINIREAIGLHLEGEDLADLGFSPDATVVVMFELPGLG